MNLKLDLNSILRDYNFFFLLFLLNGKFVKWFINMIKLNNCISWINKINLFVFTKKNVFFLSKLFLYKKAFNLFHLCDRQKKKLNKFYYHFNSITENIFFEENPKFIFTFIYLAWYNNLVSKSGVPMSIPRTHLNRIEECKQLVFLIFLFFLFSMKTYRLVKWVLGCLRWTYTYG